MRRISVLLLALNLGAACKPAEKSLFEEKREGARSSDRYDRRVGARRMVGNCCYPEGIDPSGRLGLKATQAAACGEVGRLLATETENDVLEALISGTNASCYRQFPVSTLARLCTSNVCSISVRRELVNMLSRGDPDPEVTKALLAQLVDSDERIQTSVSLALGNAGEADLWPAIDALSSPDPVVRRAVTRGFTHALSFKVGGPLDLPALVPALVRATYDSEPDIATSARIALKDYRAWAPLTPEQVVAHLETITYREVAIQLLGVRQFSCRTQAAASALSRLASGPEPEASDARYAIARRKQRCPRLVD